MCCPAPRIVLFRASQDGQQSSPTKSSKSALSGLKDILPKPSQDQCGYSPIHRTRVVGGKNAAKGSWPWLALIGYKSKSAISYQCGGSLITKTHVLTAAHCAQHCWMGFNI